MNKFIGFFGAGIITVGIITGFTINTEIKSSDEELEIPEDVSAILKKSCFGCHNTESKNEKGKGKLTIDDLGSLSKGKLAAKLNKIVKELDEGEMPPEKYAEKFPEKVPTKQESKKVIKWAKSAAKAL